MNYAAAPHIFPMMVDDVRNINNAYLINNLFGLGVQSRLILVEEGNFVCNATANLSATLPFAYFLWKDDSDRRLPVGLRWFRR